MTLHHHPMGESVAPPSPAVTARLCAAVASETDVAVAAASGVSRTTVLRACAGLPITRGSRLLIERYVAEVQR
jgi:hypothetical protein